MKATIEAMALPAASLPARERLEQIARAALEKTGNDLPGAKAFFTATVQTDASMLWELFRPVRDDMINGMMAKVRGKIMRQTASSTAKPQQIRDTKSKSKPSYRKSRPRASIPRSVANKSMGRVAKLMILETLMVDGIKLGDCTVRHAKSWGLNRAREGKFIEMALANMPLDEKVSKFLTNEEANALWIRSGAMQS